MATSKVRLNQKILLSSKASWRQCSSHVVVLLALILTFSNPVLAKRSKLNSIYFNSENSIVIEAGDKLDIALLDLNSLVISNSKLSGKVASFLEGQNFDLEIEETKSEARAFWSFNDQVSINLRSKDSSNQDYQIETRSILEDLVYEISFVPLPKTEVVNKECSANGDKNNFRRKSIVELSAKIDEREQHQLRLLKLEQFITQLDSDLADALIEDQDFQTLVREKQDSTALVHLADNLVRHGEVDQALGAYREALALDPDNHNAQLGLAKISPDEEESLRNYLSSIDDDALISVSESWFKQGKQSRDMKSMAKALVAYQFAILKNPQAAEYRYNYAKALENSGPNFYEQAAQRYLEAAALAKQEYLAGIETSEPLLRNATEALILAQVKLGDFVTATKFCNSYLNLGFKKFQNGKSILGLMKELEANRNPFRKELAMLGGYDFD